MIVRSRDAQSVLGGTTPVVSVIVPCYNYGHFLPMCVGSVLEQPGVEVDVLIIDDASTDGSGAVAEALSERDSRIRFEKHFVNRGHIATYNEGLEKAQGDYVLLLSADDLLTPGSLVRSVALMEAFPSVGLVYGRPLTFLDKLPPAKTAVQSWSVWPGERWIRYQAKRGMSIIFSPEAVMRTSVQRRAGNYRKDLPHTADLEMWLRIASVSDVGRVNGADQGFRREHPNSMMQTSYSTVLADLRERLRAYDTFVSESAFRADRGERLRQAYRRAMAIEALDWAASQARCGADGTSTDQYVAFARQIYPAFERLSSWNEYRIRTSQRVTVARSSLPLRAAMRDVRGRWRWQRWSRFGL